MARSALLNVMVNAVTKAGRSLTRDFGEIVFLMVEDEELDWKKQEKDSREDFANGFDFDTAFTTFEEEEEAS